MVDLKTSVSYSLHSQKISVKITTAYLITIAKLCIIVAYIALNILKASRAATHI